jgi:drug/metabolite transporter (DMT)-like permease
MRTGAAVFVVVYSSTSAWTALLAYTRGTEVSDKQWVGVALVTVGLVLNGYMNQQSALGDPQGIGVGFLLCLVGTVLHSFFIVDMNSRLREPAMTLTGTVDAL